MTACSDIYNIFLNLSFPFFQISAFKSAILFESNKEKNKCKGKILEDSYQMYPIIRHLAKYQQGRYSFPRTESKTKERKVLT